MSTRNLAKLLSIVLFFISSNSISQSISLRSEISCGAYKAYLGWTNLANSSGTEIYSSLDGINFNLIQTVVGNSNFVNVNQTHGTSIRYKVRNIFSSSFSNYSNTINLLFICPLQNFKALAITCESIELKWDKPPGVLNYSLSKSINSGPYITIGQFSPNTATYTDSPTINNANYQYTIAANYPSGVGVTFLLTKSKCTIPTIPKIVPSDCGTITISWSDYSPDNVETGYEIYRSDAENGDYELVGNVLANVLTYTDNSNLIEGQTYFYKIKGIFNSFSSDLGQSVSGSLSMYTLNSGSWTDPTVWSCGRIPTNLDDIIISEGHSIIIEDNIIGNAKNFINNGQLTFGIGANLILNTP